METVAETREDDLGYPLLVRSDVKIKTLSFVLLATGGAGWKRIATWKSCAKN